MDKTNYTPALETGCPISPDFYGVIGVCGVVGNLIARVLLDHGYYVIGTDQKSEDECTYKYTLKDYNIPLYLSGHAKEFFKRSKYFIIPPSLTSDSELYRKLTKLECKILGVEDIIRMFKPKDPVICITGTNGKTTTTTLLKYICYNGNLTPTEHGFKELQGNIEYIPPLQCRLKGDISILETGTFGEEGDLKFIMERCQPDAGLITNITSDHLVQSNDFLQYAKIKGEMIQYLQNKHLIINGDDPTIIALLEYHNYQGRITSFGIDHPPEGICEKQCLCGNNIRFKQTIAGSGYFKCSCGVEHSPPDYLASNIKEDSFLLTTPQESRNIKMKIRGLHNIYNALGAIAVASEIIKIPLDDIQKSVEKFPGVSGRGEFLFYYDDKKVFVDFAHNPGGLETVLREWKKIYSTIAVVITISSESGIKGDIEIIKKALKFSDYVIPASYHSREAANKYIESNKIIYTQGSISEYREGTVGATKEQVMEGLEKGLSCDVEAVICLGEAAVKYKEQMKKFKDTRSET